MKAVGFWRPGCPVGLSDLRVLTVTHCGFDSRATRGQLVVNDARGRAAHEGVPRLYQLRFPIRHMTIAASTGRERPADDGDLSGSFECRQAVPSPCTGGNGTGNWSKHAYGEAVDINPVENPYVGCGQSRDPASKPYLDRSRHRRGMVTPRASRRSGRSAGAGAEPGRATRRTTCTSPPTGTDRRAVGTIRSPPLGAIVPVATGRGSRWSTGRKAQRWPSVARMRIASVVASPRAWHS